MEGEGLKLPGGIVSKNSVHHAIKCFFEDCIVACTKQDSFTLSPFASFVGVEVDTCSHNDCNAA